jgi:hypothetical protein
MINKRAENFDFFLSHLYDEVGSRYNIDGDKTRALVKYVRQFHQNDDQKTLKHLQDKGSQKDIQGILDGLAAKEHGTSMIEDSMHDYAPFAMPEGMALRQTQHINFSPVKQGDSMKLAGPVFSLPVSDSEKVVAQKVRKSFEQVLKKQDSFMKFLAILFDHLEELEDQTGLVKIAPLIKRYEQKMKKLFNAYIREFSKALSIYENSFSDTEMDDIRDLIIENIRSMREVIIDIITLMKDIASENFITEVLEKYTTITDLNDKLKGIIRDEWFGHIDYDILGRIKLGQTVPLSINKRG